ncbi:MAG: hypothetical protein NZ899_00160 [Thermoguttaceae bacterium]|nr:hypothetical protein [Thermoguttaceae bacterium]MDW8077310.1 hypothetical protein [Thermoguttaceae bacterium]
MRFLTGNVSILPWNLMPAIFCRQQRVTVDVVDDISSNQRERRSHAAHNARLFAMRNNVIANHLTYHIIPAHPFASARQIVSTYASALSREVLSNSPPYSPSATRVETEWLITLSSMIQP